MRIFYAISPLRALPFHMFFLLTTIFHLGRALETSFFSSFRSALQTMGRLLQENTRLEKGF
uniref:Uncharacterized protein n=1 Tax=Picea glauca TaxID=3330 RepID=A0A117NG66_PICGL|nr:hypothetical protein ABT39_MTgene1844 [Picea glauca]